MKLHLTFLVFAALCLSTANAQIQFTNRNDLLHAKDVHSGVPVGIADMNGDGLEDIITLDAGQRILIQYQTPDPNRPFISYELDRYVDNNEQNDIVIADFNNDGANDILTVGSYDRVKVFYSIPYTYEFDLRHIVVVPFFSQGATAGDFNHDGWVDVVMLNDNGYNYAMINDGAGNLVEENYFNFTTVPPSDDSGNYGSLYTDFDMDGDLDFYIAKCRQGVNNPADARRINVLFVNDGAGNYTQNAAKYGLAVNHQTWTADFGDIDNDGDLDCFMTQHNVISELYENINNDTFINITPSTGLDIGGIPLQGMIRDFDNDGFQDILASGDRLDFYRNNGDKTFTRQNSFGNVIFGTFALGDLNRDGFTDVYASRVIPFNNPDELNEDILFLNTPNDNHFLSLEVRQPTENTSAIGAMALLYGPWGTQVREVRGGEQYGVSNSHFMIFGLGEHTAYDSLVIRWPDGTRESYNDLTVDHHWSILRDHCAFQLLEYFGYFDVICENEDLELALIENSEILSWSNGVNAPSITVTEPGLYFATHVNDTGCITKTLAIEISNDPDTLQPKIIYEGFTSLCNGDAAELVVAGGLTYLWSNGEATPAIEVGETGDYFVSVQGYCKLLNSDTIHMEFVTPEKPVTTPDTFQLSEVVELTATGDNITWFSDPDATDAIGSGNVLTLTDLTETTVVYARNESIIPGVDFQVGPVTQEGNNKYNAVFVNGGQIFTVIEPLTLRQITMYTDTVGPRVIEITNGSGFLFDKQVDLIAGMNVVDIEAVLEPGQYTISTNTDFNMNEYGVASPYLWRSSSNVDYPYTVPGIISIDNSTFGADFYYYFYDFQVTSADVSCYSEITPAEAFLGFKVSVEPIAIGTPLVILPNPTTGWIHFEVETQQPYNLQLFSLDGTMISASTHQSPAGNFGALDMSAYQQGIYLLKVQQGDSYRIGKIVRL